MCGVYGGGLDGECVEVGGYLFGAGFLHPLWLLSLNSGPTYWAISLVFMSFLAGVFLNSVKRNLPCVALNRDL